MEYKGNWGYGIEGKLGILNIREIGDMELKRNWGYEIARRDIGDMK